MTMPDFARGWEKDGWELYHNDIVCLQGEPFKHPKAYYVNDMGLLGIETFQDLPDGPVSLGTKYEECGDPQTAKAKAEALMEGL